VIPGHLRLAEERLHSSERAKSSAEVIARALGLPWTKLRAVPINYLA